MKKMAIVAALLTAASFHPCAAAASRAVSVDSDIVIYGSTPAALSAAVQAKRMGRSAVIVCPETRIGGLTTGGLGATDIGNKAAFGGIALDFYKDVAKYYGNPDHLVVQFPNEKMRKATSAGEKQERLCAAGRMLYLSPYEPQGAKLDKREMHIRAHALVDWALGHSHDHLEAWP